MIPVLSYRLMQAVLVALMVGVLTFILTHALPGDMAFRIAAGRYGYDYVNAAAAAAVGVELGLGLPAWQALGYWIWDLLRLDLGHSLVSGEAVFDELRHQLGHSFKLAVAAVGLSLLLGPPIGILAGLRPGGRIDRLTLLLATVLRALPQFVIGIVLVMLFAVQLGWLPAAGHGTVAHTLLPALTLALGLAAVACRVSRNAMQGVASSAFYAFGRSKGLSERRVFSRHGLRNVAVPVLAHQAMQLVYLIEGVVVVETLFAWPGIGHALVHAIVARDVPMIQGTALVLGLMFVLMNALVDLLCHRIDPRRREA
ncbi:ABC transporter permease [Marinobacterium rhizophilum]|uniref:ABC transporter permease n=1 Tax=Marinobacterium rhizophilum TaxID=420402 RepID=A0ABY5HMB0_9GAMM|nr:ABC transporter permease [Marinobacterium rhizophilum]UTW13094.1 ABC transporter permease [Marinobacterium rhizophilum]